MKADSSKSVDAQVGGNQADNSSDYLEFSNTGEVPVNAFKLLGASSKRGDSSKIGYFGTGLKYALAVLLREDIDFKVYSGSQEIKIGTRKTKFLDQVVTVITVNGEKTSITIEAGIDWETWFAIREIYSNNLDENGTMKLTTETKPEAGFTKIYIERNEKLKDLTDNWNNYFSNSRQVLSKCATGALIQKNDLNSLTVFRRGIRAYTNRTDSMFDYDVLQLKINESRVAEHDYEARQRCAEILASSNNLNAIEHFLHTQGDYIENDTNFWTYLFDDYPYGQFSEQWFEALKDKRIVPKEYAGFYGVTRNSVMLPEKLCKHLYKQFKDKLQIMGTTKEAYLVLDKSVDFVQPALTRLATVGFTHPIDKIKLAKFKDADVQGLADDGLVLLSECLEDASQQEIAEVLFEEIAHTKSGHSDNTREFQTYLIRLAVALIRPAKLTDMLATSPTIDTLGPSDASPKPTPREDV